MLLARLVCTQDKKAFGFHVHLAQFCSVIHYSGIHYLGIPVFFVFSPPPPRRDKLFINQSLEINMGVSESFCPNFYLIRADALIKVLHINIYLYIEFADHVLIYLGTSAFTS